MNTAQTQIDVTMQTQANAEQYLTFVLAEEEYGVDILRVQGIRGWNAVTRIPNTPDYILGVINLRGMVVPIVDLRRCFKLPSTTFGPMTVVVVVKVLNKERERTIGLVVDAVSDVYNVVGEAMKPPPDFGGAISTDFVKGLATVNDKMIILLDIDFLINTAVLNEVFEQVTHPAGAPQDAGSSGSAGVERQ
jgi:purine-binding chemotaxis protein CheW